MCKNHICNMAYIPWEVFSKLFLSLVLESVLFGKQYSLEQNSTVKYCTVQCNLVQHSTVHRNLLKINILLNIFQFRKFLAKKAFKHFELFFFAQKNGFPKIILIPSDFLNFFFYHLMWNASLTVVSSTTFYTNVISAPPYL